MSTALRKQIGLQSVPHVSFGPFRFLEAMPWLAMAAAMRVIAFGGGIIALPALIFANIAVLHAFLMVAQRSIELASGQTGLGNLDFKEQSRLSVAILWRTTLLMIAGGLATWFLGYTSLAPHLMQGLDGMAFDQFTDAGKFWSAALAALVLLMIVGAENNRGKVSLLAAAGEFARRGLYMATAVVVLGAVYLGLGLGQGWVRNVLWNFWQVSTLSQTIKSLIFFVFIFSCATLRLWVTLLIMTYALKRSYVRGAD